jgi:hypothetical protein
MSGGEKVVSEKAKPLMAGLEKCLKGTQVLSSQAVGSRQS